MTIPTTIIIEIGKIITRMIEIITEMKIRCKIIAIGVDIKGINHIITIIIKIWNKKDSKKIMAIITLTIKIIKEIVHNTIEINLHKTIKETTIGEIITKIIEEEEDHMKAEGEMTIQEEINPIIGETLTIKIIKKKAETRSQQFMWISMKRISNTEGR